MTQMTKQPRADRSDPNIVIAHTNELTELDRAIGDADHGVNLARGFRAVLARMDTIVSCPWESAQRVAPR